MLKPFWVCEEMNVVTSVNSTGLLTRIKPHVLSRQSEHVSLHKSYNMNSLFLFASWLLVELQILRKFVMFNIYHFNFLTTCWRSWWAARLLMARENDDITLLTNPSPLPLTGEKGSVARVKERFRCSREY